MFVVWRATRRCDTGACDLQRPNAKERSALRVLLVTAWSLSKVGGVASHLETLKKGLLEQGNDVDLISLEDVVPALSRWFRAPIRCLMPLNHDTRSLAHWRLRLWLAERTVRLKAAEMRCEVIHAHDVVAGWMPSRTGWPTVVTVHGPLSRETRISMGAASSWVPFAVRREAETYRSCDRIIAVDTGQKDIIVSEYGLAPTKVEVIPNAVDVDAFRPPDRRAATDRNRDYLLVPRRFVRKNGVETAIRALARMPDYGDYGGSLLIAGDGPERMSLEGLAESLSLRDKVVFLGEVPRGRLRELVQGARAILIPSQEVGGVIEATSIAALEGMAAGKPVVASDIGGLREIIVHQRTGFLCEHTTDPGSWAALLADVLGRSDAELRELGVRAREYVVRYHNVAGWVRRISDAYATAVEARALVVRG